MPDEVMSEFPTSTMSNLLETDWWRVGAALGVVLVFTVARRPIAKLFLSAIRACLSYFEFDVSDDLRLAVQRGAELFVFSLGLIAAIALFDFQGPFGDISNKISMSVLVIAIFSAAFETKTIYRFFRGRNHRQMLLQPFPFCSLSLLVLTHYRLFFSKIQ